MKHVKGLRNLATTLGVAIGITHGGEAAAQRALGRILIETVSSGAVSVAGGLVIGALGVGLNQRPGVDETVAAFWGAIIGTSLGAGAGAAIGGRLAGVPTDIARPLAGAVAGSAAFLVIIPAMRLDPDYAPFWIAWFVLPVAGAVSAVELGLPRVPVYLGAGRRGDVVAGVTFRL